ncbi:hypothetical protein [Nitrospira sp. Kam-Ns4a]
MKKLAGLLALALMLTFGTATFTLAGDPAPAPTEKKDKKPSGPKADEEKKDEKKGGN